MGRASLFCTGMVKSFIISHKWFIIAIVALIIVKMVWATWACWGNGTFEGEKVDLLQRRDFLVNKIVVNPKQLLCEMPDGIGRQFQGEWALYSCSMLSMALSNMVRIYPETKDESVTLMDSLIRIVMSPELRHYDKLRWGEDPLLTLEGDKSHISYLSHLAWMVGNYKDLSLDDKYNELHDALCEAMYRRITQPPLLNLPTYPDEPVYVPDMLVAIAALSHYAHLNNGKYSDVVVRWTERARSKWIDDKTGLLVSILDNDGKVDAPVKGSYSALNCYLLTLIDPQFASEQYDNMKTHFRQGFPFSGIKEYSDRSCWIDIDIDAGVILFNLSPSGTAFAIGCATYFGDTVFRNELLRTAEIAGHTVTWNDKRQYLLANIALVGEAITLAMRTSMPQKRP